MQGSDLLQHDAQAQSAEVFGQDGRQGTCPGHSTARARWLQHR